MNLESIPRLLMNGSVHVISDHSSPKEEFDVRKDLVKRIMDFNTNVKVRDMNLTNMTSRDQIHRWLWNNSTKILIMSELQAVSDPEIINEIKFFLGEGRRAVLISKGTDMKPELMELISRPFVRCSILI